MKTVEQAVLDLHECFCTTLAEFVADGKVQDTCICAVYWGETVPADYCGGNCGDKCGMAWVRLAGLQPAPQDRQPGSINTCLLPKIAMIELGLARCALMPDSRGNLPDSDDHLGKALEMFTDLDIIMRAVHCCFGERGVEFVSQAPLDGGDCVGQRVLIAVMVS